MSERFWEITGFGSDGDYSWFDILRDNGEKERWEYKRIEKGNGTTEYYSLQHYPELAQGLRPSGAPEKIRSAREETINKG
jgi:hypothetical protein